MSRLAICVLCLAVIAAVIATHRKPEPVVIVAPDDVQPVDLALAAIVLTERLSGRLPAIFVGMAAGVAVHLASGALLPGLDAGPIVSPALVPDIQSPLLYWEAVPYVLRDPVGPRLMFSFAVALACVASIDSMVGTMAIETRYHVRSRPDRDLLAQGIGNAIAGAFGGAAISYSVARCRPRAARGRPAASRGRSPPPAWL